MCFIMAILQLTPPPSQTHTNFILAQANHFSGHSVASSLCSDLHLVIPDMGNFLWSFDRGHIVFVLSVCLFVCLSVCLLSTLTFAITGILSCANYSLQVIKYPQISIRVRKSSLARTFVFSFLFPPKENKRSCLWTFSHSGANFGVFYDLKGIICTT